MGEARNNASQFNDLLDRWKKADDKVEAVPFALESPRPNKSKPAIQNEDSIREYKKTFKAKNFKTKIPTRGMSVYNRPAKMKNVFGAKVDDVSDYKSPYFEKTHEDVKLIRESIANDFFFDGIIPTDLDLLVDAFEPMEVKRGTIIIKQGDKADFFYVVGQGAVTFLVNDKEQSIRQAGDSFGEIALLYSCPRAATVVAGTEPTMLFRVDQQTFMSIIQKQSKVLQEEKTNLLKSVDFLQDMDDIDLKRLAAAMTHVRFEAGECLVKKGDVGIAFYLMKEGEMKVTDISIGSTTFEDVLLKPGDYFGERALATKEPRVANVTATASGIAYSIDQATFEKILGKFSRVIMKAQDRRVIAGIDVLASAGLSDEQLQELSSLVIDKAYIDSEKIFDTIKRRDASLFIVREGAVQLAGNRMEVIKPGGYFGEDLLLLDARKGSAIDKQAPTKCRPLYTATAMGNCLCGILTLSECRTIFDTTKLVEAVDEIRKVAVYNTDSEGSDDEMSAAATPLSPLGRASTTKWLEELSMERLRKTVRTSIQLDDFNKIQVLGEGQFGEVWLVSTHLSRDFGVQHFALKAQKKEDPTRGDSVEAIKGEIDVLRAMDHPFIVNLVHHYEDAEKLYILMAVVHGGELFDVIHSEQEDGTYVSGLPESDAKFYAMVIADTLDYIHRQRYVFRDLKPENVLIDKDGYPIICDFGFAKYVTDKTYSLCGTPKYLAPEIILNRGHNASVDHWALGVLIYEMVAGENPFFYDGMAQLDLFQCIAREKFYPLPDDVSDDAFYVIDELLVKDPTRRLGSLAGRGKDIIAKDWFRELDLGELREKKHPAPFLPKNDKLIGIGEESQSNLQTSGLISTESPLGDSMHLLGTASQSSLDDWDADDSEARAL